MDVWIVSTLAVMNKATMNIHMLVFMWAYVFSSLGYILRSGIAGSYGNSNFLRNCHTVFQTGCLILHPTSNICGFRFLHTNLTLVIVLFYFPTLVSVKAPTALDSLLQCASAHSQPLFWVERGGYISVNITSLTSYKYIVLWGQCRHNVVPMLITLKDWWENINERFGIET